MINYVIGLLKVVNRQANKNQYVVICEYYQLLQIIQTLFTAESKIELCKRIPHLVHRNIGTSRILQPAHNVLQPGEFDVRKNAGRSSITSLPRKSVVYGYIWINVDCPPALYLAVQKQGKPNTAYKNPCLVGIRAPHKISMLRSYTRSQHGFIQEHVRDLSANFYRGSYADQAQICMGARTPAGC